MKQHNTPKESAALRFLYHTAPGRLCLRLLTARWVSKVAGALLSSPLSKPLIGSFLKKNGIDLSDYEEEEYRCFNDCFCRRIRPELRPIESDPNTLIAPCDGLLSVYPIKDGTVLPVKQSQYTIPSLLKDEALAAHYRDGVCLVFRLCVNHYHRYAYADTGRKGENVFLPGRLHTVRPIALEAGPVFTENCREYTVIESPVFGRILQMEVGAMLVGKICNLHGAREVRRGEEKGMFLYGGSTIILCLEKDRVTLLPALLEATANGIETPVRLGEALGHACSKP